MTDRIAIAADQTQTGNTIIPNTVPHAAPHRPAVGSGRISIDSRTFGSIVALLAAALIGAGTSQLAIDDTKTAEALRPSANVAVDRSDANAASVAQVRTDVAALGARVSTLESEEQQQDREIGELMVLQIDALAYLLGVIKELAKKEHLDIDDPPATLIDGVQRLRSGQAGKRAGK